jgi:superfamily II DNA or RNA helicase
MQKSFTWANFDAGFLQSVLNSGKIPSEYRPRFETDDPDLLSAGLNLCYPEPNAVFVSTFHAQIGELLAKYPDKLREIMGASGSADTAPLLDQFMKQPPAGDRSKKIIAALTDIGSGDEEAPSRFVRKPDPVNLRDTSASDFPLFSFQKEAVAALQKAFLQGSRKSGMLVMPTGSGKTMTTAYFLLRYMIPLGYQVIWLAHRHLLLTQAAGTFYDNSFLIKLGNAQKERFQLVCVSGEHDSIKSAERDDDALFLSVPSVFRNLDYLESILRDKLIVVVDEAHHTVAKTYLKTIRFIQERNANAKLLGLTATPIRSKESESAYLQKLFDWPPIHEVKIGKLIEGKYLADPKVEVVETGENYEASVSQPEAQYMEKFNVLPESMLNKIADSKKRNALIVAQYMKNRDEYKKTLIFALNNVHARTLHDDLTERGVKCGCVYSDNPLNAATIQRFVKGELEVLVNINIMTEGSDVPDIQTVMLTRPTNSDVLLMQMIGRAMRGANVGGTDTATIVDFHDQWGRYNYWINPEWLIEGSMEPPPDGPDEPEPLPPTAQYIPWGQIRDFYNRLLSEGEHLYSTIAMPYGWYSLEHNGEDYTLLVFEDQEEGYEKLIEDAPVPGTFEELTELANRYFGGFCLRPSEKDLKIFLENLRDREPPYLFLFEDRNVVEPSRVAAKILKENLNLMTYPAELYAKHPIVENLFGRVESYRESIFHFMNRKEWRPGEIVSVITGPLPFEIDGPYHIGELMREVIDERFGGSYPGVRSIRWTDRPYRSYYGRYSLATTEDGKTVGDIMMNLLLNSSQVPREVIKYVVYHELLHRDYWRHDKKFREMERKYPNYVEWERFLDYRLPRRYGFPYLDDKNRAAAEKGLVAAEQSDRQFTQGM